MTVTDIFTEEISSSYFRRGMLLFASENDIREYINNISYCQQLNIIFAGTIEL